MDERKVNELRYLRSPAIRIHDIAGVRGDGGMVKKKKEYPEQDLQKACVDFLNMQAPKDLFYTAINPISQKPIWMAVLSKAMGMKKSVPDMLFLYRGRAFFVEYKFGKCKPDKWQRELFEKIEQLGFNVYVVHSIYELQDVLKKERVI